jgi:hypothetical protein
MRPGHPGQNSPRRRTRAPHRHQARRCPVCGVIGANLPRDERARAWGSEYGQAVPPLASPLPMRVRPLRRLPALLLWTGVARRHTRPRTQMGRREARHVPATLGNSRPRALRRCAAPLPQWSGMVSSCATASAKGRSLQSNLPNSPTPVQRPRRPLFVGGGSSVPAAILRRTMPTPRQEECLSTCRLVLASVLALPIWSPGTVPATLWGQEYAMKSPLRTKSSYHSSTSARGALCVR